jgi:DNA-binding NtrC family response regulator
MIFADGPVLEANHLPTFGSAIVGGEAAATAQGDTVPISKNLTLAEVEKAYIQATLAACGNHIQQAAEILGISRKNLWEKRKKYGLME